jgi:hypothetical protein
MGAAAAYIGWRVRREVATNGCIIIAPRNCARGGVRTGDER